ncbi:MAG: potassium transporter TrkA [Halobacteriales archaeon]
MTAVVSGSVLRVLARIAGIALLAGGVSLLIAVVYRWYARLRLPVGLSLLAGFGVVAVYLNTTAALGQAIEPTDAQGLFEFEAVLVNVVTFGVAGAAGITASQVGDRLGRAVSASSGTREFDGEVGRIVTAVGRSIAVTLPETIEDIDGYDPEPDATKAALAGKTLLFPRRLTVAELRDRLVTRLKEDYGVGHVSLDLDADGTVSYLAAGRRAAGLGPTLAPGDAATAIRADPPFAASSGDAVQIWTGGEDSEHVATAEFRAKSDDVVTLAIDELDAGRLDPAVRYRLVTLPGDPRPDREFAGLLRAADETFEVVAVADDSALRGAPVGAIDATVVAVGSAGGAVEAIPGRDRTLDAGDTLYVIARPETLRRLEAAAGPREVPT